MARQGGGQKINVPAKLMAPRIVPAEHRAMILEETKTLLLAGSTLKQIAEKHEISERSLRLWILGSDDEELLKAWVDSGLVETDEILENLEETDINAHLKLAKVREMLRRGQWYAERRNRSRYGDDKLQVNVGIAPTLVITVAQEPQTGRVIEGDKPQQITEVKCDQK